VDIATKYNEPSLRTLVDQNEYSLLTRPNALATLTNEGSLHKEGSIFAVGYHEIHPDISVNFQLNRFSDGSAEMVDAMRFVAPRIKDYRDYTREISQLSHEAYEDGRLLHGALFLRSAEFYMFPDDPAKQPARLRFMHTMREVFQVNEAEHLQVPYGNGRLYAYRFTPPTPKSTIVVFGGFDSYIEEWFPALLFLRDAGYDIVAFDGPGQGAALEDGHLPMHPDWDRPVTAVLDHFDLDDVTLLGISLGGCLTVRAAAKEPRVRRVVCDDVLVDFYEVIMGQLSPARRHAIRALLWARASAVVNPMVGAVMRQSLVVEWGVRQGMHVTGTSTPYDFLRETMCYETRSLSRDLTQDVLVMAGTEDHYVPVHQFAQQIDLLTNARSVTARLFTRSEQAQNHVQVGNLRLSLDVIVSWLEGLETRNLSTTTGVEEVPRCA
jgi:pimeloyl-ACP methyl ester carboxylesterase